MKENDYSKYIRFDHAAAQPPIESKPAATAPPDFTEQARQLVTFFFARVKDRPSPTVTKRLIEVATSALAEAATQGQATNRKFIEGSTEDFSDPAGRLIKELNRKRKAHLMGDCAGDACPDWIDEQIKVIATFASEVAKYSQIDGQAVGIERALRAASDGNNIRMAGGSTEDAVGTARLIQQAIRALSPDPSYPDRVRNEAATAALEQAAQVANEYDPQIGDDIRNLIYKTVAIGDDKK